MPAEQAFRQGSAPDFKRAIDCLQAAGLPTADLTPQQMGNFLFATRKDESLGMVGLDIFPASLQIGLLRSLLVEPKCRGTGLGRELVAAVEAMAAKRHLHELWLLTIDAQAFFAPLGYVAMPRADAPSVIQATAEFSSLCPGDAVLMCKRLR